MTRRWRPSRQGSLWRERPPKTRGGRVARGLATFPPARGAPAAKMRGSLPPLPPLSCGAPPRRARGGRARRSLASLFRSGRGESVPTRFQCGFPGTTWTTTARTPPSERGALGWSKSCPPWMSTPPSERWTPLRRHVLDPRRRKSSIMSRPLEAGSSCSHWSIFSMTTPRPPWRSIVS